MKISKILLLTAALVTVASAAAPTHAILDGTYEWEYDAANSPSTALLYDTLGATDSSTILTNFVPEKGYDYILANSALTGTGSDSLLVQVRVDCKDASGGNVIYSTYPDTIALAPGNIIHLELGALALGVAFDVKLISLATSGTQIILNRILLYKRRGITTNKAWR